MDDGGEENAEEFFAKVGHQLWIFCKDTNNWVRTENWLLSSKSYWSNKLLLDLNI